MSEVAPQQTLVDTLESHPIKERKNSLEHALSHRPTHTDLEARQILHPGHPDIVQTQHALKTAMTADSLKKALAHRATQEELLARNILPEEMAKGVSPALVGQQRELERSMLEDALKGKLQKRPDVEQVVERGILNKDEVPM
ncbi:hypothetical protein EDC01DRAFT_611667 [Geopyxis carbonaria]|nr:hypothetical protein EDC01DRAFT_611667 [Geopyxis carbonaria]